MQQVRQIGFTGDAPRIGREREKGNVQRAIIVRRGRDFQWIILILWFLWSFLWSFVLILLGWRWTA